VDLSLVFRPKTEIEQSLIEVSAGELRDGNYALNQIASLGVVSVETRPEAFALLDNYPNPFNPETTIKYHLPEAAQVKLEVYNMVGQVVRTLVSNHQNAGRYVVQWDAANDNGHSLASGIYLYHVQAGDFRDVKKMLLLK
jgi:methionine-rich copper-binding protein CopC